VKALVVGVLAMALAGCSRQPASLAGVPPCSGWMPCHATAAMPAALPPPRHELATTKQAAVIHRPRRRHLHEVRLANASSNAAALATDTSHTVPLPPHAPTVVAEPHPVVANPRTIQQQVAAAAAVAERMSGPDVKANNESRLSETASADAAATAPANKADRLVVVLMARPDIKSLSELTGKTIAIDGRYSASNGSVRTAIAAAGALEVQLTQGQNMAIDRLVNGETPAAVLALVSANAAESFPEIAGYKTFHIPLSPHALNKQP
jgi:hypothetical protein